VFPTARVFQAKYSSSVVSCMYMSAVYYFGSVTSCISMLG